MLTFRVDDTIDSVASSTDILIYATQQNDEKPGYIEVHEAGKKLNRAYVQMPDLSVRVL